MADALELWLLMKLADLLAGLLIVAALLLLGAAWLLVAHVLVPTWRRWWFAARQHITKVARALWGR